MKLVKDTTKDIDQKISDKEAEEAFIKILNGWAKILEERGPY